MKTLLSFLVVWILCSSCSALRKEPHNANASKREITEWMESGGYARSARQSFDEAREAIGKHLPNFQSKKLAVVLDVDETLLSTYDFWKNNDFGFESKKWASWVKKERASAVPGAYEFYRWARGHGIAVFFVVDRLQYARPVGRDPTYKNLKRLGFDLYEGIYYRPRSAESEYKSVARCDIERKGYEIVATLSDQSSDFGGGCLGFRHNIKMPNPLY